MIAAGCDFFLGAQASRLPCVIAYPSICEIMEQAGRLRSQVR